MKPTPSRSTGKPATLRNSGRRKAVLAGSICGLLGAMVAFVPRAQALTLYFDADLTATGNNTTTGANLGFNATGTNTWTNAVNPKNFFNPAAPTADVRWTDSNDAVFTGTAGTVSLGGDITATSVTVNTDGYNFVSSVAGTNRDLTSSSYTIAAGVTATLSTNVRVKANTVPTTKLGDGTLILASGANQVNVINLNAGTLVGTSANVFGAAGTTITFGAAGAKLELRNDAGTTFNTGLNLANFGGTVVSNTATAINGKTHTVGAVTIGTQTLGLLAGGNVAANSAYGLTLGAVTLSGSPTFNVANNGAGAGTLTLSAGLAASSSNTITKTGTGTLALTTNNAAGNIFSGPLQITEGTVSTNITGGTGTGTITIGSASGTADAKLLIALVTTVPVTVSQPITISGNATGVSTIQGNTDNVTDQTVSSPILLNHDVVLTKNNNNGIVTFSNSFTGTNRITIDIPSGAGTINFTGNNSASLTGSAGQITVLNGRLNAGSANALGNNTAGASAATVNIGGTTTTNPAIVGFTSAGTFNQKFNIVAGNPSTATLTSGTNSAAVLAGAITMNDDLIISKLGGGATLTVSGPITNSGSNLSIANSSTVANTLLINSSLANFAGTITGTGAADNTVVNAVANLASDIPATVTMVSQSAGNVGNIFTLSGNNSAYTAGVEINSGTLAAANANALGSGAVKLGAASGTSTARLLVNTPGNYTNSVQTRGAATGSTLTVASGAATGVAFNGGTTGTADLNLTSGAVAAATLALGGATAVNHTGQLINLNGNSTTTVSADIGSAVTNVIQNGPNSTLVLTGSSLAYTGSTQVLAGSLRLGGATQPLATIPMTIAGGGTLSLQNGATQTTTVSTLTLGSGSGTAGVTFELDGTTGANDVLASTNAAITLGNVSINAIALTPLTAQTYNFTVITAPSGLAAATYAPGIVPDGYDFDVTRTDTAIILNANKLANPSLYFSGNTSTSLQTASNFELADGSPAAATPDATRNVIFSAADAQGGTPTTVNATLDGPVTVRSLTFRNVPPTVTAVNVSPGTPPGTLTITPGSASAGINVQDNAGTITISAPVAVGAAQTWTVSATGASLAVTGGITGTDTVTKAGTGTLTLAGTVDAPINYSAGNITLNTTPGTVTVSKAISGNSPNILLKSGTGQLNLNAASSYSGGTSLNGGITSLGNKSGFGTGPVNFVALINNTLQSSTDLTGANAVLNNINLGNASTGGNLLFGLGSSNLELGGTVKLSTSKAVTNNATATGGILTFSNATAFNFDGSVNTDRTLTFNGAGGTVVSGGITQSGTVNLVLTKAGAGTLSLFGTTSTYTGGTNINAGLLKINNGASLGPVNGGIFMGGGNLEAVNTTGNPTVAIDQSTKTVNLGTTGSIIVDSGVSYTLGGVIQDTTSGGILSATGAGTLILNNTNTYTGGTVISGGTVRVLGGNNNRLGANSAAVTINANGTLSVATSFTSNVARNILLGASSSAISVDSGATLTVAGVVSDGAAAGTLNANGPGTISMTGTANTYTGGTVITGGGTVKINLANSLGSGPATLNQGTLDATAAIVSARNFFLGATNNTIQVDGTATTVYELDGKLDNLDVNTAGSFTKAGVGVLFLASSGLNSYTGATTISAGTLRAANDTSLGSGGAVNINAATLEVVNSSAASLTATRNFNLGAGTDTLKVNAGSYNITGTVGGAGDLNANGAGTLVLSGSNNYTGRTLVSGGGTVQVAAESGLGTTPASPVADQLTLNNGKFASTADFETSANRGLTVTGATGNALIPASGTTLTFDGAVTSSAGAALTTGDGTSTGTVRFNGSLGNGTLALTAAANSKLALGVGNTTAGAANQNVQSLTLAANTLASMVHGTNQRSILQTTSLSLTTTSRLDVFTDAVVVNYTGSSPIGSLTNTGGTVTGTGLINNLRTAYNDGAWDGFGIGTSAVNGAAGGSHDPFQIKGLGIVDNSNPTGAGTVAPGQELFSGTQAFASDFGQNGTTGNGGLDVADNSVLLRFTYYGDTNLDGQVTSADYANLDSSFSRNTDSDPNNDVIANWYNGDFNYDGLFTSADYTLIDAAFTQQNGQVASAGSAGGAGGGAGSFAAVVPEPGSTALLAIGGLALGMRRRRKA